MSCPSIWPGAESYWTQTYNAICARSTCMYVGVLLHVRLLVEPLATVLTGVGPRVAVDQQVGGQGGGALETLPTLLALKHEHLQWS